MKPSEKSLYKLKHIFNLLGLRIIPAYFLIRNKPMFEGWHYNACNQTALITGYFLNTLLHSPGYFNSNPFNGSLTGSHFEIELYEGLFKEPYMPKEYNHAYVYAHQTEDEFKNSLTAEQAYSFFIDVARISNPTVFAAGINLASTPEAYSSNYKLLATKRLDFEAMLFSQKEYYTGKTGIEICQEINQKLLKLGYDLRSFDWNV